MPSDIVTFLCGRTGHVAGQRVEPGHELFDLGLGPTEALIELVDQGGRPLQLAHEHRVPVVVRGSGTGLSGGCLPVADGIVLAFDRMRAIREIDQENGVATIQPPLIQAPSGSACPTGVCTPYVPVLNADGNDNVGSVPSVLFSAPLGTYVGWNLIPASP